MSEPVPPLTDGAVTLRPRTTRGDREHLHFDVVADEAVVGEVSLLLLEDLVGQLTWRTQPEQRRRGVATRAVRLLTRYALEERGLARVQAYVDPGDSASLRIAGRSGLRREGVMRGLRTVPGGLRPDHGDDRDHGDEGREVGAMKVGAMKVARTWWSMRGWPTTRSRTSRRASARCSTPDSPASA